MNFFSPLPPDWTGDDAKVLRTFLETDSAKKAFSIISDLCPPLLDGADVNKALTRAGEVKGWQAALVALVDLVSHKPETEDAPTNYPDPDDESKWQGALPK